MLVTNFLSFFVLCVCCKSSTRFNNLNLISYFVGGFLFPLRYTHIPSHTIYQSICPLWFTYASYIPDSFFLSRNLEQVTNSDIVNIVNRTPLPAVSVAKTDVFMHDSYGSLISVNKSDRKLAYSITTVIEKAISKTYF